MNRETIHQAIHRFLRLDRLHRQAIEQQVGEMGLHRSQHRLLMMLAREEEMPSQAELARRLEISPPAVTGLLTRLEKDGYITRTEDARDSRNHKVLITPKGREILAGTRVRFDAVDRAMMAGISEEELLFFTEILGRMQENLQRKEEGK